uniref:Variant surface glycoprotein 1125.2608 n=1 Tax=Trypanosoma brucei TaxID=5691 RepID=A0A1J0R851_9TRYP|nr:variant surface glycoprotein 1125.2608 [Trypanosoma brucei]
MIALAFVSVPKLRATAAVSAGENAPLFRDLCTILSAAETKITIGSETTTEAPAVESIHQLNLTFSGQAWKDVFKTKPGKGNWREEIPDAHKQRAQWKASYLKWLAAAKADEQGTDLKVLKAVGAQNLKPHQKAYFGSELAKVAAQVSKIAEQLQELKATERSTDAESAQKLLKTAAFGREDKTRTGLTHTDMFTSRCAADAEVCCKDDALDGKPPKTIAVVIMCVCAADSNLEKACINPQTALTNWANPSSSESTEWTKISAYCTANSGQEINVDSIDAALDRVLATAPFDTGKLYIGAANGGACRSGSANGFCTTYTAASATDTSKLNSAPWLANVRKATRALRLSKEATEEAKRLKAQIATLYASLSGAAAAAARIPEPPALDKGPTVARVTELNTNCEQHKINKTARENTGK